MNDLSISLNPDEIEVEVWCYPTQCFIPSVRCPGEFRVRADYHGDLSDLAVYEVCNRQPDGSFTVVTKRPQFRVDWT